MALIAPMALLPLLLSCQRRLFAFGLGFRLFGWPLRSLPSDSRSFLASVAVSRPRRKRRWQRQRRGRRSALTGLSERRRHRWNLKPPSSSHLSLGWNVSLGPNVSLRLCCTFLVLCLPLYISITKRRRDQASRNASRRRFARNRPPSPHPCRCFGLNRNPRVPFPRLYRYSKGVGFWPHKGRKHVYPCHRADCK